MQALADIGVAYLLVAAAFVTTIYASLTRGPRRGTVASVIALGLALASAAVAQEETRNALSGCCLHDGEPGARGALLIMLALVGAQTVVVLASILNAVRHSARRRVAGRPT